MASASTAPLTSIAQATSFEQLCDIEDLVYPSDDEAIKDLLADSAVQVPPDCNLSRNVASVKKARRKRACCVVWLRHMLHTPDVYLQLPPSLVAYAQGIYHLRAEHLSTDRWAVSLATTLALNMADHGDTPVEKSGGGVSGASGPVSKKAARVLIVNSATTTVHGADDIAVADVLVLAAARICSEPLRSVDVAVPASVVTGFSCWGCCVWPVACAH
jgi:hypothetical protein